MSEEKLIFDMSDRELKKEIANRFIAVVSGEKDGKDGNSTNSNDEVDSGRD